MRSLRRSTPMLCALCLVASAPRSALAQSLDPTDTVLARQLDAVEQATARYQDAEQATRDGYVRPRFGIDAPLMGEHWVNRTLLDAPVDLTRPAVLQYVVTGGRRVLVGVTYGFWQHPGDEPPEGFAGSADRWHTHDMETLVRRMTARGNGLVRWAADRSLEQGRWRGSGGRTELAMLHVWLWSENPEGIFANYNPTLPYLRADLPATWARARDHAAARGIGLLQPGSCRGAVRRFVWAVRADGDQRRALSATCERAARQVAAAERKGLTGDSLNAVAAEAWRSMSRDALASLSAAQLEQARRLKIEAGGDDHEH